ncbi:MAG: T9SS type A sorting domain-containing protein [Flavobacteriales bacterium]|nr:T9SS type A sorting domain-containing protein [Flavobacteriales bacterium]
MKYIGSFLCMVVWMTFGYGQSPMPFQIEKTATASVKDQVENYWQASMLSLEIKDYMGNPDKRFLFEQKQAASAKYPRKKSSLPDKGGTLPNPIIQKGFDANPFSNSVPLDNYLAVSDSNRIVSVTNLLYRVYSPDGTNLFTKTLGAFCAPAGLSGINNGKFDPKVIYDPDEDRFIAVVLNASTAAYSKIVVAFSQTNDPTGVWNFYVLPGNPYNDTTWFDYPAINITKNELFITGNQVRESVSWQSGFKQTVIWQIRKKDGYEGNTLQTNLWNDTEFNGRRIRNLHPVKWGESIQGPNQYFISNRNFDIQNDTLFFLEINDTIGAPGLAFSKQVIHLDKKYGVPPNGKQKDINRYVATNDGRILAAFYQNDQIQFASTSIDTANGRSGIYFGIISGVQNQIFNLQTQIISVDTLDFGYPNLSWVGDGATGSQSILSFEHSGENRYPGMSALFYADQAFSDIITIKEGVGNLVVLADTVERWGDYSGSQPIYNRNGKIWICGTYGNGGNRHQTWVAQLDNPYGTETALPANTDQVTPPLLYPNPSQDMVYLQVTIPIKGKVNVSLMDMNGRVLDVIFMGISKAGLNQFSFNAASLSSGVYFLIFEQEGQKPVQLKFIKP